MNAKMVDAVATKRLGPLPTATGGIARLAYSFGQQAGIDLRPLLKKAGLTDQQIKEQAGRLAVRHQIAFLNGVASALGDEFLGFHLAQLPDLRELGLIFYVAASSDSLGEALQRAARYSSTVNEGLSLKYLKGKDVRMVFEYVGVARHSDRHQLEFLMTMLIRLCRHLTGLHLTPSRVRITHRRAKHRKSQMAAYFGRNINFGASLDELAFSERVDGIPIKSADPYLSELLMANGEQALAHRRPNRGAFRVAVENAIVPLLPHGDVRASEIASRLGFSQRTSARRLASEGVTFSEVLQMLRRDLAGQYLSDPDLSISRIAWLLGYREISAFTHAFKRWSGKTPRQARTQTLAALVQASRTPAV
jgi:AraC-like DNA-binding protein